MIAVRLARVLATALVVVPIAARADGNIVSDDSADPVVSDDSDSPDIPPCTDTTDVVGYRQCPVFGEWGEAARDPYVFVDVGMNYRHFVHDVPAAAARRSGMPTTGSTTGGDDALTVDERIGVGLTPHLYAAVDIEFGNFGEFDSNSAAARDVVLDGLGSLGLRGSLGPFSLAVEAAGGGMAYTFPTADDYQTEAVLELRGRGEIWLAPWFTIGATGGASMLRKGEWIAGLYMGFHTRAYAGDR